MVVASCMGKPNCPAYDATKYLCDVRIICRCVIDLVVIFSRLVVKIEHLVVILIDLVVKITSLVVLVKLWNTI